MTDDTCTLPPEPASVAAARRYVERILQAWGVDDAGWTCVQLISELATNAVIHARTEFTVELSRDGELLRVRVSDASPAAAGVRHYSDDSTTGRGLRLVASMTADWGVQRNAVGKAIWFELDLGRRGTAQTWDDGTEVDLDALLDQFGEPDGSGPATALRRSEETDAAWRAAA